jgi:hypothetical protein
VVLDFTVGVLCGSLMHRAALTVAEFDGEPLPERLQGYCLHLPYLRAVWRLKGTIERYDSLNLTRPVPPIARKNTKAT